MKSIVQHCWHVAAEKRAAAECDCQNVAEERWFWGQNPCISRLDSLHCFLLEHLSAMIKRVHGSA